LHRLFPKKYIVRLVVAASATAEFFFKSCAVYVFFFPNFIHSSQKLPKKYIHSDSPAQNNKQSAFARKQNLKKNYCSQKKV
jgi:hypothetical protein